MRPQVNNVFEALFVCISSACGNWPQTGLVQKLMPPPETAANSNLMRTQAFGNVLNYRCSVKFVRIRFDFVDNGFTRYLFHAWRIVQC